MLWACNLSKSTGPCILVENRVASLTCQTPAHIKFEFPVTIAYLTTCFFLSVLLFALVLFIFGVPVRFYISELTIIAMADGSSFDIPFDQLPNPRQVWVGSPGSYEEGIGKLAILTPDVVAKAATEIKTGRRATLGWQLTKLDYPNLNRQPCHHQIVPLLGGVAFDDIFTMNPRMSNALPGRVKKRGKTKIAY